MIRAIVFLIAMFVASMVSGQNSLYEFKVNDIEGNEINLAQFKGKKVLVVNTASKCGLTPQYEGLEKLYKQYEEKDFVIVGFPANNFLKQEPGTNDEIAEFCQKNYGVSFPMMSKISVKGDDIHPLYQWLTSTTDSDVKWNFQKYMIDPDGSIHGFVSPKTKPYDEQIISWIEGKE